ncbi:hypothetical protein MTR_4g010615 [Medicago truncatula]|uniref:Uncharacterized protein n=1 Tax=Medicago truncatula TaxID=3880 RepID=A0A072UG04_MEDTR|nr:hypothetical protein MTR_4g010615 [Medicago truncatula]
MAAAASSSKFNVPKRRAAAAATCSYLPKELWERIFKFLNDNGDNNMFNNIDEYGMLASNLSAVSLRDSFKSLSVVSKQFLSITNSLRFSVSISDGTIPLLHRLFERFPNIRSIDITLSVESDLNALLTKISTFPLDLKSLTLYHPITVPADGLRAFSKEMKNLTSLTCYRIAFDIDKNDLFFIADCFPLLEELILTDLDYHTYSVLDGDEDTRFAYDDNQLLELPKLRKIALSRNFIGCQSINYLCRNCGLLQDVKVIKFSPRYQMTVIGRCLS